MPYSKSKKNLATQQNSLHGLMSIVMLIITACVALLFHLARLELNLTKLMSPVLNKKDHAHALSLSSNPYKRNVLRC